jgi:hypothetical protein
VYFAYTERGDRKRSRIVTDDVHAMYMTMKRMPAIFINSSAYVIAVSHA